MDQEAFIEEVNKKSNTFFLESRFYLDKTGYNSYKLSGDSMSEAINFKKNINEKVNVLSWFKDFWLYVEVKFVQENTFISLSVFQGNTATVEKSQLFRAEWDDYNNPEEKHPQPHWHITSSHALEVVARDYAEIATEDDFLSSLDEEKTKVIDVSRMHFAMNGNWQNNDSHVHNISEHQKLSKWFIGLLDHLKHQLDYAYRKT